MIYEELKTIMVWSTALVAIATLALPVFPFLYLRAATKFVRLQLEPNLWLGFKDSFR